MNKYLSAMSIKKAQTFKFSTRMLWHNSENCSEWNKII